LLTTGARHPHFARLDIAVNTRLDHQIGVLIKVDQPFEAPALLLRYWRAGIVSEDVVLLGSKLLQLGFGGRHISKNQEWPAAIPRPRRDSGLERRLILHAGAGCKQGDMLLACKEGALAERPKGCPCGGAFRAGVHARLASHRDLSLPDLVVADGDRRSAAFPDRLQHQVVADG